jgi:hypothetical protein
MTVFRFSQGAGKLAGNFFRLDSKPSNSAQNLQISSSEQGISRELAGNFQFLNQII